MQSTSLSGLSTQHRPHKQWLSRPLKCILDFSIPSSIYDSSWTYLCLGESRASPSNQCWLHMEYSNHCANFYFLLLFIQLRQFLWSFNVFIKHQLSLKRNSSSPVFLIWLINKTISPSFFSDAVKFQQQDKEEREKETNKCTKKPDYSVSWLLFSLNRAGSILCLPNNR